MSKKLKFEIGDRLINVSTGREELVVGTSKCSNGMACYTTRDECGTEIKRSAGAAHKILVHIEREIRVAMETVRCTRDDDKMYSFVVKNAGDVDFPRILRETEEDRPGTVAILVTSKGNNKNGLLFLSNRLLERFDFPDNVCVSGGTLNPLWGLERIEVYQSNNGGLSWRAYAYGKIKLDGWRARRIDLNFVSDVKREVEAALNYKRRFKINVHRLV